MLLGPGTVRDQDLQLAPELPGGLAGVQLLLGEQPGLDALGQLHLLLGIEQRHLADQLQVVLDRVGGGSGAGDLLRRRVPLVTVGQGESAGRLDGRTVGRYGFRGRGFGCLLRSHDGRGE